MLPPSPPPLLEQKLHAGGNVAFLLCVLRVLPSAWYKGGI